MRVPGASGGAPAAMTWLVTGRPATLVSVTVSEEPAPAMVGLFGQARNTSSHARMSGVNTTDSWPVTVRRSGATSKDNSTTGRCGHRPASYLAGSANGAAPVHDASIPAIIVRD